MSVSGGNRLVVLGLDPGLTCTGYGLVGEVSGVLELIGAGTIRPKPKDGMEARLGFIFQRVSELIGRYEPDEGAVENVFTSVNPNSAMKLGQARGAAMSACGVSGLPVFSYEPTVVKKSLVGVGRAEKSQVSFMVGRLLGVTPDWAEDAGDALAVAVCHLNQRRFNKLVEAK